MFAIHSNIVYKIEFHGFQQFQQPLHGQKIVTSNEDAHFKQLELLSAQLLKEIIN